MRKRLLAWVATTCLLVTSAARAQGEAETEAEPGQEATTAAEANVKRRASTLELGIITVPWGMAYTRSGLGLTLRYTRPLVERPGILWETTSVSVGVREFYGYVNNSLAGFVEITPIAFFKLHLSAAYDTMMVKPFSGGVRVLTPAGRQKLADGAVARGDPGAIDWVEGRDNRDIFTEPVPGDGLRLRIQSTLQGRVGPIVAQYNFAADFNFYRTGIHESGDVFHDTFTFTLRKLRDRGFVHELLVAYEVPGIRDEVRLGVIGRYYHAQGTDLDHLSTSALAFYRPRWQWLGERLSPWLGLQAGTNLLDPMHQYDFAWVSAAGLDVRLY